MARDCKTSIEFTVYEHVNKINGKRYIGITSKAVQRRWRPDGSGYKNNPYFWHAIQKYGWDSFEHRILHQGLSEDEACRIEKALIAQYHSNDLVNGYNIADGGKYNVMPQATRERLSRERKGKNCGADNPNYGNHKLAGENNPNYGKRHSEEVKRKMSENRKGKGLHCFSEEHKRRIKEHHKGGADPKRVICLETGMIFKSINDAARYIGGSKKAISNCCRKIPHYNTAKGYHWEFAHE